MNLKKEQSIPFEIPELCSLIAFYLTLHDLTQLCLVCKRYSQFFRPFLWSKIVLDGRAGCDDSPLPWIEALKSNGHLVEHAELFSWQSGKGNDHAGSEDVILKNDDEVLAKALLAQCGSKLRSLKVHDLSANDRIWYAVLERIGDNRRLEGTRLLDGVRVLDITLTTDSNFRSVLTRPYEYPEAVALFAGVTELRFEELRLSEDYDESTAREDVYEEMEPITIHFRDLVKLFPNLCKLTLDKIIVAEPQDDVEGGSPQSTAVATITPLNDYQFHTLDFRECIISAGQIVQILKRTRRVQSLKIGFEANRLGDVGILINSLPTLTPLLTEYGQYDLDFSGLSPPRSKAHPAVLHASQEPQAVIDSHVLGYL
ncbi:hypothetical protein BGZ72_005768 [Mortierella alpina]|nr:hypothetical protein BGZ72_005768 [Mortierella alpina]